MENSQKTMKILIAVGILIVLATLAYEMSDKGEDATIESQTPSSEENKAVPADSNQEVSPSATDGQQTGETPAQKESTPAERADRTVAPSDAATYSEDDLPPDYNAVP